MMYLKNCTDLGLPPVHVPHLVRTPQGYSFFNHDDGIFSLQNFIEGEHFDGSRRELSRAAQEIGRLHQALEKIPFEDDVKRIKGTVISHDRTLLEHLLKVVKKRGPQTPYDAAVLSVLDEIDDASLKVTSYPIDRLPLQVIHYDLHPHNALFDTKSKEVLAILDYDVTEYNLIFSNS